jgi:hypothetical protein
MATKKKIQREIDYETELAKISERTNIGDDVIKDISLKANLTKYETEIGELVRVLANGYQHDKLIETFWKEGIMPKKGEVWRPDPPYEMCESFAPTKEDLRPADLGNNIGHRALLELYDRLWIWWDDTKKFKTAWNEMKIDVVRDVHGRIVRRAANDDAAMLFIMIAHAIDSDVTDKECLQTWDRARKRGWRKAAKNGAPELEHEYPEGMTFEELGRRKRPKPPVSRKKD